MNLAAVDFLRAPAPPRVGWALLLIGMMALGIAVWLDQQWTAERRDGLQQQQFSGAARQALAKPARPAEPSAAQRRLQQAETELRRPWLATLRAIESATVEPVYLLSISIEPGTGIVRLEAEAPSFERALTYIETLNSDGALRPATLVSHMQATAQPSNLPVVRFSVSTQWNPR